MHGVSCVKSPCSRWALFARSASIVFSQIDTVALPCTLRNAFLRHCFERSIANVHADRNKGGRQAIRIGQSGMQAKKRRQALVTPPQNGGSGLQAGVVREVMSTELKFMGLPLAALVRQVLTGSVRPLPDVQECERFALPMMWRGFWVFL